MHRLSTQFETPPLIDTNEIIGWLIRYDAHLAEVKRDLGEINRKLDHLLPLLSADHMLGFRGPPASAGPNPIQTQNDPLGSEGFNPTGTYLTLKFGFTNQPV